MTPRFAPVAPLPLLWELMRRDQMGDYHLLLAHDVLANRKGWESWRLMADDVCLTKYGHKPTVIMDSSVIELGEPMPIEKCCEAAKIVQAEVIVMPDRIGDPDMGIRFLMECDEYRTYRRGDEYMDKVDFMFVPQGRNLEEYAISLQVFQPWSSKVKWIGIPRDAVEKHGLESRKELIDLAVSLYPDHKIHMLGFSNNVRDDFVSTVYHPNVQGIDSAVPVRAGQEGIFFEIGRDDYGKRGNYWEQRTLCSIAVTNVEYVRGVLARGL